MNSKFDLNAQMERAEQEFPGSGGSGDWYKLQEGANGPVRVLTPFEIYAQHYKPGGYSGICLGKEEGCPGCEAGEKPGVKWMCYVYDKQSKKIMLAKFAYKIAKQVQAYQNNPEYAFDEAPMPYDITINAVGAGTKEVTYTVVPGRTNSEVPETVMAELAKRNTTEQIKTRIKNKQRKALGLAVEDDGFTEAAAAHAGGIEYPTEEINPEDIPF